MDGPFPAKGMPILYNYYQVSNQFLLSLFFYLFNYYYFDKFNFFFNLELSVFEEMEMLDLSYYNLRGGQTAEGREREDFILN